MNKLIAFDMDSTLIQCEVIDEIAKHNGVYSQVSKITELAMQGQIDFDTSLRERVRLLKGTPITYLVNFKENLPYTQGLEQLIHFLKQHEFRMIILSGGFDIFAKHICQKFGFDGFKCNYLEIENDHLTGEVINEVINADKKAHYLEIFAQDFHVDMENTVAVGDGANDLKMIQLSRVGIAFNAKPSVRAQAKFHVDIADLEKIIPILKSEFK